MADSERQPLLGDSGVGRAMYTPVNHDDDPSFTQLPPHYDRSDSAIDDRSFSSNLADDIAHHKDDTFIIYTRRWWLLFLFSVLSFMQGGLPNVWTVIAQSAEAAFGWSDTEVSVMQAWVYGCYLISIVPCTWLMDTKGLRASLLVCGALLLAATGVRCASVTAPYVTWCAHLGHALLGLSGPAVFTAGPALSAMWFPPHQRATATAVATIAGFAGAAGVFLVGPMVVEPPKLQITPVGHDEPANKTYINIEQIKDEIWYLRLGEFGVCALIFVAILAYFPNAPPTPPSLSAACEKLHFKNALKSLFKHENFNFWLVGVPFGMSTSVYGLWSSLFDVNLKRLGISEAEAGWFGFYAVAVGCVAAVVIGRIADFFGHMKLILLFLVTGTVLSTFWFLLQANEYIEAHTWSLYMAVIIQGLCVNGAIPLYYELAIEATYPAPEAVSSAMLTIIYQIFPLLFLMLFLIPHIGRRWMNWVMYAVGLGSFPMLVAFREKYKRLQIDNQAKHLSIQGDISSAVIT